MKKQLHIYQQHVELLLQQFLETALVTTPDRLKEAIHYATLNQGKRLRPALVFAAGDAMKVNANCLQAPAMAIELLHSYSLVHDDLPAMDDDELRRGKPTCHIQYDEATAILVGDAQQSLAFEVIATDPYLSDAAKVQLISLLAKAGGANGMIGGQTVDLMQTGQSSSLEQIKTMHSMKTGALIQASLLMGACQGEAFTEKQPGLVIFGEKLGLAFQVHDDILDIESTSEQLGKPQGSDEANAKSTFPSLIGLEESKRYRNLLIEEALTALSQYNIESKFLQSLAHYIVQRTF